MPLIGAFFTIGLPGPVSSAFGSTSRNGVAGIVDTAHLVTAEGGGLILVLAGVPEPARDGVAALETGA